MGQCTCAVDGCESPREKRDWCEKHYQRWKKYGDASIFIPSRDLTPEDHFWSQVDAWDCWLWMGKLDPTDYGSFSRFPILGTKAHRISYFLLVGELPKELVLDHLCRIRHCVNPDHLELVTRSVNSRRGAPAAINRSKTHCPEGHEYLGGNLVIDTRGSRNCRVCRSASSRSWYRLNS